MTTSSERQCDEQVDGVLAQLLPLLGRVGCLYKDCEFGETARRAGDNYVSK